MCLYSNSKKKTPEEMYYFSLKSVGSGGARLSHAPERNPYGTCLADLFVMIAFCEAGS